MVEFPSFLSINGLLDFTNAHKTRILKSRRQGNQETSVEFIIEPKDEQRDPVPDRYGHQLTCSHMVRVATDEGTRDRPEEFADAGG
jgi:hypothetical protein